MAVQTKMTLAQLLMRLEATASMGESRKLSSFDAIKLNGFVVKNIDKEADFFIGDIIQIGKSTIFEVKEEHLV